MARHTGYEEYVEDRLVLLDELRVQIGGMTPADMKAYVEREGVKLYVDWKGDFGVTVKDARRLRAEWIARKAERDRREAAFAAWRERREVEHQEKLQAEARERREAQERELQHAREAERERLRVKYEREAAARAAERARFEPDTSRGTFERETGGV